MFWTLNGEISRTVRQEIQSNKIILLLCLKFAAWQSVKSLHSKHSPEKFQITFGNFQKLLTWGLEGGWSLIYVEWSWKVRGECPVKVTVHKGYILYTRQNFTGSQCSLFNSSVMWSCLHFYWAVQVGLLTPLIFARHHLSPLAAFTSSVYFLHNGRILQSTLKAFLEAHGQNVSGNKQ